VAHGTPAEQAFEKIINAQHMRCFHSLQQNQPQNSLHQNQRVGTSPAQTFHMRGRIYQKRGGDVRACGWRISPQRY
jgi:hypothetical protein